MNNGETISLDRINTLRKALFPNVEKVEVTRGHKYLKFIAQIPQVDLKPVTFSAGIEDWIAFRKKYGKGHMSARLRDMIRHDLSTGNSPPFDGSASE